MGVISRPSSCHHHRSPRCQRRPPDKAEAQRIVEAAGFTQKRTEILKARPLIGSFAEADEQQDKPRRPHWTEGEAPDSPRMEALRKARDANPLVQEARAAMGVGE